MTDRIRQSTPAFALLLSLILALSSWMATGLAAKSEWAVSGQAKLVRADLHSHGRPAPESADAELQDNEDDDTRTELLVAVSPQTLSLQQTSVRSQLPTEVRSLASVRIREGHGARGPPLT